MIVCIVRAKHAIRWFLQHGGRLWSLSEAEIFLHMSNVYVTTHSGLYVDIHSRHAIVPMPSSAGRYITRAIDGKCPSTLHAQWRSMSGVQKSNIHCWMPTMLSHEKSNAFRWTDCWTLERVHELHFRSNLLSLHTRWRSEYFPHPINNCSHCSMSSGRWFVTVYRWKVWSRSSSSSVIWWAHWCSAFYRTSRLFFTWDGRSTLLFTCQGTVGDLSWVLLSFWSVWLVSSVLLHLSKAWVSKWAMPCTHLADSYLHVPLVVLLLPDSWLVGRKHRTSFLMTMYRSMFILGVEIG